MLIVGSRKQCLALYLKHKKNASCIHLSQNIELHNYWDRLSKIDCHDNTLTRLKPIYGCVSGVTLFFMGSYYTATRSIFRNSSFSYVCVASNHYAVIPVLPTVCMLGGGNGIISSQTEHDATLCREGFCGGEWDYEMELTMRTHFPSWYCITKPILI